MHFDYLNFWNILKNSLIYNEVVNLVTEPDLNKSKKSSNLKETQIQSY